MVGGVGDIEVWVILEGEKEGKVGFQRLVCTSQPSMSVLPASCSWVDGSLIEKCVVKFMPVTESRFKYCSVGVGELKGKRTQLSRSFCLRSLRYVALDDLDLMELAELNGKAWISFLKQMAYSTFRLPQQH